MINLKKIAAGTVIAGALGAGALGIGAGTASAHPWHPGGPGYGYGGGPGWYPPPPPPPPPYYGYGGYNPGPPCVSGPLGFLQVCA